MKLFLLLGTNLGDREANIREAMKLLEEALGKAEAASQIVETEAISFDGPAFLNCVARWECRRRPETVLGICKRTERAMGRDETPEYRPDGSRVYHSRVIDIDILVYGGRRMDTPQLTIPHPQVEGRPFVKPLLEQAGFTSGR